MRPPGRMRTCRYATAIMHPWTIRPIPASALSRTPLTSAHSLLRSIKRRAAGCKTREAKDGWGGQTSFTRLHGCVPGTTFELSRRTSFRETVSRRRPSWQGTEHSWRRHELRGIPHFWYCAEIWARPLSAAAPPPAFTTLPGYSKDKERQTNPPGAARPGR
jgi:hypothetical protein